MPETLISPEVTARLKALNDRLPAAINSSGIFECPLWMEDPVSNLSYPVSRTGKEIIAGKREGSEIYCSLFKSAPWKRIRAFCNRWIHREVCSNTSIMGLEFDLASIRRTSPVPAVFISAGVSPEKDFSSLKAAGYRWIMEGLECLMGKPLKKDVKDNLISCLDAIPGNGRLDLAALMLSRPLDAVRIVVRIPEEEIGGYLSRTGFPGKTRELPSLSVLQGWSWVLAG